MIDRGLSEEYVAWWLDNAVAGDSYDLARHAESHMRAAEAIARYGPDPTLIELYERYAGLFGQPLAAEAFRRGLLALALRGPSANRPQKVSGDSVDRSAAGTS